MTTMQPTCRQTTLPIHSCSQPESFYRPFFLGGIAVILTAGAAWGAALLWQIARAASFTEIGIHAVNAHGHAQIFGWIGLFVMGFGYQAMPRAWSARLAAPHLAPTAFLLMLLGIAASTIGQWLAGSWTLALPSVLAGGVMQIVAISLFTGQIVVTFRRSAEPFSPPIAFIITALGFFFVMSVMSLWHAAMLMTAESRDALLHQIAAYQGALRDLQIHGFALFMILGVSMRFFPGMFGLVKTPPHRAWWAFGLLITAVFSEVALLIGAGALDVPALRSLIFVPWALLFLGVGIIVLPWRLWRPLPHWHRSNKFVRIAFLWLGISLALLLVFPGYMLLREMEFSHAYYGATRHAITVGFISLMIMGVAARVVPALTSVDHHALSRLWGPFILVNVGCAIRVSTQILTDWHDAGFALIGFSGMIELAGLGWWGAGLVWLMVGRSRWQSMIRTLRQKSPSVDRATRGPLSSPDTRLTVREIADRHPDLVPALSRYGIDTCCNAHRTLEEIAIQRGVAPERLAAALIAADHPSSATCS